MAHMVILNVSAFFAVTPCSLVDMLTTLRSSLIQRGSNMTGTNCDLFTHKSSGSYLNHLVSMNMQFGETNTRGEEIA